MAAPMIVSVISLISTRSLNHAGQEGKDRKALRGRSEKGGSGSWAWVSATYGPRPREQSGGKVPQPERQFEPVSTLDEVQPPALQASTRYQYVTPPT